MQRLKTRAQFDAVMAGSTVARTAHFALHRIPLDGSPAPVTRPESAQPPAQSLSNAVSGPNALFAAQDTWIGAMVPKRWAKRAVTRNAIKRQIYAVSQSFQPPLPVAAHVVRLRQGFGGEQFVSASSRALKRAVRGELQALFAQAAP